MEDLYRKFAQYYDLVYEPVYDYKKECDNIEGMFSRHCERRPSTIMDIGCGTGSHALELTRRGYKVAGIDISSTMIENARRKAQEAGLRVDFAVQDMTRVEFGERLDAAICMFGGFGYLKFPNEVEMLLGRLKEVLREGGTFVFEFWNREMSEKGFKNWLKRESDGTTLIRLSEGIFDGDSRTIRLSMDFYILKGAEVLESFREEHSLRCYDVSEIADALSRSGFELNATYNKDIVTQRVSEGEPSSFNVIAVARRA